MKKLFLLLIMITMAVSSFAYTNYPAMPSNILDKTGHPLFNYDFGGKYSQDNKWANGWLSIIYEKGVTKKNVCDDILNPQDRNDTQRLYDLFGAEYEDGSHVYSFQCDPSEGPKDQVWIEVTVGYDDFKYGPMTHKIWIESIQPE